jgi:hypothetical protein
MNFKKLASLLSFVLGVGFFVTACDDDSTSSDPVTPVNTAPQPAKELLATSNKSDSVTVKWTASPSVSDTAMKGYILIVDNVRKGVAKSSATLAGFGGLTDGKHTFEVKAFSVFGKDTLYSTSNPTVTWAPAMRFETNGNGDPIKLYVSASEFGSGLNIFDSEKLAPQGYKTTSIEKWTVGLSTKEAGKMLFGPAADLGYATTGKTLKKVQISAPIFATSLDEVFDSKAMDTKTYLATDKAFDLKSVAATGNAVFFVKEAVAGGDQYSKILIKYENGSYLKGTGDNQYIECVVSYQSKVGVPYAKTK